MPNEVRDISVLQRGLSAAMLQSLVPKALVCPSIGPREDAKAIFPIADVLAAILPTIWPVVAADAMYDGFLPHPLIPTTIAPCVETEATDSIVLPRAEVLGAVRPQVHATPILLTLFEGALKAAPADPRLDAPPLLLVRDPLAHIGGAKVLSPVRATAMSLIGQPLAGISVTTSMCEATLPLSAIFSPLTLVAGAVSPKLHAEAVSSISNPFAMVHGTTREVPLSPRTLLGILLVFIHY
mmetsp:Transcript_34773/g.75819  ORF Transcript_34773/g.75819 Transcript_34773/m.75819 type:complete len:239 (+) Transcript_34773:190-906(+)|eukprot:CAMPEP_0170569850 /NCGR_PEP_ID=MMETSP0224-20130122/783_1 /TAXON_ID=285029 /ORGANISM="Togula jolla, Strain CCCM 725" /LENGTH=238 /DNA_ID=CAMNT_0010892061 /DNA_START=110 /DNA_END=826 /DNA_ORIENTATION=-